MTATTSMPNATSTATATATAAASTAAIMVGGSSGDSVSINAKRAMFEANAQKNSSTTSGSFLTNIAASSSSSTSSFASRRRASVASTQSLPAPSQQQQHQQQQQERPINSNNNYSSSNNNNNNNNRRASISVFKKGKEDSIIKSADAGEAIARKPKISFRNTKKSAETSPPFRTEIIISKDQQQDPYADMSEVSESTNFDQDFIFGVNGAVVEEEDDDQDNAAAAELPPPSSPKSVPLPPRLSTSSSAPMVSPLSLSYSTSPRRKTRSMSLLDKVAAFESPCKPKLGTNGAAAAGVIGMGAGQRKSIMALPSLAATTEGPVIPSVQQLKKQPNNNNNVAVGAKKHVFQVQQPSLLQSHEEQPQQKQPLPDQEKTQVNEPVVSRFPQQKEKSHKEEKASNIFKKKEQRQEVEDEVLTMSDSQSLTEQPFLVDDSDDDDDEDHDHEEDEDDDDDDDTEDDDDSDDAHSSSRSSDSDADSNKSDEEEEDDDDDNDDDVDNYLKDHHARPSFFSLVEEKQKLGNSTVFSSSSRSLGGGTTTPHRRHRLDSSSGSDTSSDDDDDDDDHHTYLSLPVISTTMAAKKNPTAAVPTKTTTNHYISSSSSSQNVANHTLPLPQRRNTIHVGGLREDPSLPWHKPSNISNSHIFRSEKITKDNNDNGKTSTEHRHGDSKQHHQNDDDDDMKKEDKEKDSDDEDPLNTTEHSNISSSQHSHGPRKDRRYTVHSMHKGYVNALRPGFFRGGSFSESDEE